MASDRTRYWTRARRRALVALVLSAAGAAVKLYGSIAHGSKALLVDGLTCLAGLVAGVAAVWWLGEAMRPPDADHLYGHERLVFGGVAYTLVAYGIAAGYGLAYLSSYGSYEVDVEAFAYALGGIALYALAILAYRGVAVVGAPIAAFTASELLEGAVSAGASLGGSLVSYVIDYVGAWVIESYLIYELVHHAREMLRELSDTVTHDAIAEARRELEERGFKVTSLRLRRIVPGRYQGDAIVEPPEGMHPEAADLLVDEASMNLNERGIDLTIHIDIARRHGDSNTSGEDKS